MGTAKSLFIIATTTFCLSLPGAMRAADAGIKQAVAVLHPTQGNKASGTVRFTQEGNSVKVVAHIEGLNAGQKHAIHIHEFGDCSSADGMSAGGHYNPEKHEHGLPDKAQRHAGDLGNLEADASGKAQRHAGDLGNLEADASGKAHLELTVNNITISGNKNPILGRGVIVHAKVDDGGQPVGNAGGRIACGVIGVANTAEKK